MAKFMLSSRAKRDVRDIITYTATTWSRAQAVKYYDMLMETCRLVAHAPSRGKRYEGVAENLQGSRAGKHIVFYKTIAPGEVLIVRILHSQMDLIRHF